MAHLISSNRAFSGLARNGTLSAATTVPEASITGTAIALMLVACSRIYASLHKMKRSYIRSFVFLLEHLGDSLTFPKAIPRNLGVEVARRLQSMPEQAQTLREELAAAVTAEEQSAVLRRFVDGTVATSRKPRAEKSVKYEFHVGSSKVTARKGECRILSEIDFSSVERQKLQRAIEAFDAVLKG